VFQKAKKPQEAGYEKGCQEISQEGREENEIEEASLGP